MENSVLLEIDQEILKRTTSCTRNFACLNGDNTVNCKVQYCINQQIHFVQTPGTKTCNYKMPFGESVICSCPVRKEGNDCNHSTFNHKAGM
jgi:hypothetical protein